MKCKNLIAIGGKKGSGKDTVAKIIQYLIAREADKRSIKVQTMEFLGLNENNWLTINNQQNYEIKRFADPIKDYICILLGCTREQLENRDFKEKELGEEWWYYKGETGLFPYNTPYEANKKLPLIKHTPRSLMQLIGTEAGRNIIHPDIWVNALFADYKPISGMSSTNSKIGVRMYNKQGDIEFEHLKDAPEFNFDTRQYPKWIITDLRFKNELKAVKDRGGITIRVNRKLSLCYPNLWSIFKSSCKNKTEITDENFISWLSGYDKKQYDSITHTSEYALDREQNWDYNIDNNGTIDDLIIKVKKILIELNIIIE